MRSNGSLSKHWLWLSAALAVSLPAYYWLLYHTPREDFFQLFLLFMVLSLIYLLVIRGSSDWPHWALIGGAVVLRLSTLGAVPQLSDDFYRFIWDGLLWNQGISPYAYLPSVLQSQDGTTSASIFQELYTGMNSPDYFTVYPPLAQAVFILSTKISPQNIFGNIVIIRGVLLAAELGTLWLLPRLLQRYGIAPHQAVIYAWNPLVIIELTGNLHFEALMIFFVVLSLWFWKKNWWWWSAVSMGLAVSTKLIPLIFLPLLWKRLPISKLLIYYAMTGATIVLCFLPFLDQHLIQGMSSSVSLYFQKFEFNASVYYVVREIGYLVKGWNIIATAGKYLALTTVLAILLLAWWSPRKLHWPQAMLWALFIYLVLTTTVHPWYLAPLVLFSCFSNFRFAVVWSVVVIVSYAGYSAQGYQENLMLVLAEYLMVFLYLFMEVKGRQSFTNLFSFNSVNSAK